MSEHNSNTILPGMGSQAGSPLRKKDQYEVTLDENNNMLMHKNGVTTDRNHY